DSAIRFAQNLQGERLRLQLTGPTVTGPGGERAAVRVSLFRGDRDTGALWIACVQEGADWKIEGTADTQVIIGLFLAGSHSPALPVEDLPSHPVARAWAQERLPALQADPSGDRLLAQGITNGATKIELVGVYHLAPVNRSAVIFQAVREGATYGETSQTVLHHIGDDVTPVSESQVAGLQSLLTGVNVDWDTQVDPAASPEAKAEALLTLLLEPFLAMLGFGVDLGPGGGAALLRFMAQETDAAHTPGADLLSPEGLGQVWGADLPERAEQVVQDEVYAALRTVGIDPEHVDVDSAAGNALLAEHGDSILRALFKGILLSTSPTPESRVPRAPCDVGPWVRAALTRMAKEPT
ncbi:MAG: hypothetical protein AB8H79_17320, partial [Myxococcota bacterium]